MNCVVFVGSDPPLSPIRFGETINLNESFAFSCSSSSTAPSFSIYSFFLATNASFFVSSGVVIVLSPNRVLLENQYFLSETSTFHHVSFSSFLISNCFHASSGLFSSNRWPSLLIAGPPFYCRRRTRMNLSMLLLLIIGGVEVNPGPSPSNNLTFGMLNIRSVVNKAPLLHSLITWSRPVHPCTYWNVGKNRWPPGDQK